MLKNLSTYKKTISRNIKILSFSYLWVLKNIKYNISMYQQVKIVPLKFISKEHVNNFRSFMKATLQSTDHRYFQIWFSICFYILMQGRKISSKVKHVFIRRKIMFSWKENRKHVISPYSGFSSVIWFTKIGSQFSYRTNYL